MFNLRNESLDLEKRKILDQSSGFLNLNPRQIEVSDLIKKYRKGSETISEYWVDLPPEITKTSQLIEPIILQLI